MFENSVMGRLAVRCQEHPKNCISHICTDARCDTWPLFCQECRGTYRYKQRHYGHELSVLQLSRGVEEICARLGRDRQVVGSIYREMNSIKGVEGLLKWQEEKQQHFTAIQKHINTIKFQIEQELANIIRQFTAELQLEKLRLYTQLQRYEADYREKFDKFARLTEPIVSLQNRFKFYASPTVFALKIGNETSSPRLSAWLGDLKRTLSLIERATAAPQQYSEQIRKYGQTANQIMDDLPRIKNIEYEKEMPLLITTSVKQILRAFVSLKQLVARGSSGTSFQRSTSMDSFQPEAQRWKHSVSYK